jgi:hypothetical protein
MLDALIIGSGYLGSAIKSQFSNVQSSSLDEGGDFFFSLEESSPQLLPEAKILIISCTSENLNSSAKEFAEFAKRNFKKVILISTASLYKVSSPNEVISENTSLKLNHPRVLSESFFESFASILHCGLLWDDHERRPENWLPRIKNGAKHVNLCKIDLVAQVCQQISLMNHNHQGHYLCADGVALQWKDIASINDSHLKSHPPGIESKILDVLKLQKITKSKIDWSRFVYCYKKEPL